MVSSTCSSCVAAACAQAGMKSSVIKIEVLCLSKNSSQCTNALYNVFTLTRNPDLSMHRSEKEHSCSLR